MSFKRIYKQIAIIFLFAFSLSGCQRFQSETTKPPAPVISNTPPILPTRGINPTVSPQQLNSSPDLSDYAFPGSIDPSKQYMFYLHGKIIEDQGIPAISPDYGEYEYKAILEKLGGYGFVVISEQRSKDTDPVQYARKITEQAHALLNAGVPASNITVVGASKGAGIAILVSHFLENKEMNFVIMANCDPATVKEFAQNNFFLYGNVLSIYDSSDELAGSCQDLFTFSEGNGISRHDEVILNVGTGHGILYKPLDEWINPTVQWARKP
jgi:hypothetical protein